jgi:hypothetical protein
LESLPASYATPCRESSSAYLSSLLSLLLFYVSPSFPLPDDDKKLQAPPLTLMRSRFAEATGPEVLPEADVTRNGDGAPELFRGYDGLEGQYRFAWRRRQDKARE